MYDHFARECPNDATGRNPDDTKGYLLRMLDTDHNYALDMQMERTMTWM